MKAHIHTGVTHVCHRLRFTCCSGLHAHAELKIISHAIVHRFHGAVFHNSTWKSRHWHGAGGPVITTHPRGCRGPTEAPHCTYISSNKTWLIVWHIKWKVFMLVVCFIQSDLQWIHFFICVFSGNRTHNRCVACLYDRRRAHYLRTFIILNILFGLTRGAEVTHFTFEVLYWMQQPNSV